MKTRIIIFSILKITSTTLTIIYGVVNFQIIHGGLETYDSTKVTATGGVLTLECEKVGSSYISGGIETVNTKAFSYGYFEIESKLPSSGTRGPWGGFWMHVTGCNEIDVLEPNGCDCELGTQFHSGSFNPNPCENSADIYDGFNDLSQSYNKYAVIWTPKYVKVLFNDEFVWETDDPDFVPNNPMYVFLTFQIYPLSDCSPNNPNFPTLYWRFKNFKYYKLKCDCSNGITQSNFNFSGHDYKVQKFYSLSNSTVPSNSNIVLRATDYIELNGEFTVPLGSTFTAITHNNICPN